MKGHATLLHAFVCFLLQHYICTSPELSEIEIFRKYCPGVSTCTELENETHVPDTVDVESCCLSCTCDEHCWERGNCCPDVKYPYKPRTVECVQKKSSYDYFIIDTCVEEGTIESTICRSDDDPRLLDDAVLVSDKNNSRIFKNRYCAECNGVTDYIPWRLAASNQSSYDICTDGNGALLDNVDKLEDCNFMSLRPNDEIHNNAICQRDNIVILTDCMLLWDNNSTLQWYYERCHKYRIPALLNNLLTNSSRMYSNIFCFLCNAIMKGKTLDVCQGESAIDPSAGTRFPGLYQVPFTKIFSIIDTPAVVIETDCESNQLFDEYQKRCFDYSCGFGHVKQNGRCVRNIEETYNVQFRLQIKFMPTSDQVDASDSLRAEELIKAAKRTIDAIHPCKFANEEAWIYTDEYAIGSFFWQFELYTTYGCQHTDVEYVINFLVNNDITVNDETLSNAAVYLIKPAFPILNETNRTWISMDKNVIRFEPQMVFVSPVTFCTSVTLSGDMVTNLDQKISRAQSGNGKLLGRLRDSLVIDNGVNRICFDTYVDIIRQMSSSEKSRPTTSFSGYLSFACTLVSVVCAGLTIVVNAMFYQSRSPAKYVVHFVCINLILAQVMFQFGIGAGVSGFRCILIGILIHYFWLSHALAMSAFVFGVVATLRKGIRNTTLSSTSILFHVIYIYGLPVVVIALNITISTTTTNHADIGYGEGPERLCYISTVFSRVVFFVVPIILIVCLNMSAYIYFVWIMVKHRMESEILRSQRLYIQAYARLSCITGFTWLFGLLSEFSRTAVFEYLFILTNCSQGVLLFFAFGRIKSVFLSIKTHAIARSLSMFGSKGDT